MKIKENLEKLKFFEVFLLKKRGERRPLQHGLKGFPFIKSPLNPALIA